MDLSTVQFRLEKNGFFVDFDRGYIGYGRVDGECDVERFAHFMPWDDVPSVRWLRTWCRDLLTGLIKNPLFK